MKDIILKAENISKQYRLGVVGTGTISHDLNRWWHKIRGKEDPYLKVGETNDRTSKGNSEYVWALQDINFEVEKGEVLGIIGKNGAGKSTLLKILSKVTAPTTGSIKSRGRIASLLEVGTGFNPELTGRENIYLNGAILGMTKKEIASKIDEIIEFSGCERYIDTPTKRYSSGMTVRLAFAVAAFLEPEILVVDEVLAVGDAEFQKKAIGKMQDISKSEGRTVLFVSHNMAAVKSLCTRGILMENGQLKFQGTIEDTIENYLASNIVNYNFNTDDRQKYSDTVYFNNIQLLNANNKPIDTIISGEKLKVVFEISSLNNSLPIDIGIGVYSKEDEAQFHCATETLKKSVLPKGESVKVELVIPKWPLMTGIYYFNFYIKINNQLQDYIKQGFWIKSEKGDFYNTGVLPSWQKGFYCEYGWELK